MASEPFLGDDPLVKILSLVILRYGLEWYKGQVTVLDRLVEEEQGV